jgi:hypothetical protein
MVQKRTRSAALLYVGLSFLALSSEALAQDSPGVISAFEQRLRPGDVKDQVNSVLSLMSYTIVPDVTTSSLSVKNASNEKSNISMTQFGGGFTLSKSVPLYMEGNAAYVRFDPKFLVSDGSTQRTLPVRWNSLTGTVGVGWDFPIADEWVLRPIAMGTIGRVFSDITAGAWWLSNKTDADLSFLNGGTLKATGLGGSLMLDYESYRPEGDRDLEVRYTSVRLRSRSEGFSSEITSQNLSIWGRYRKPTRWMAFDRPVRTVWEVAHSNYLGAENAAINSTSLTSLGVGLELDFSAHEVFMTRGRAVLRFLYGQHVRGMSLGLAASF